MWTASKDERSLVWAGREDGGYTISIRAAKKEQARARYRHDIQEAADKAGIIFKVRRELGLLESHLRDDEKVLSLLPVTHRDERGLLVATSERVMFIFYGWVNKTFISLDYQTISRMRWLGGFLLGRMRLYIYDSEHSNKYTQAWNPAGRDFVRVVNSQTEKISKMSRESYQISRLMGKSEPRIYQVTENDLIADKLVELDKKFEEGLVPQEDYFEQKIRLLREMN